MKKIALLLSVLLLATATVNAQLPSGQFLGPDQNYCPGGAGLGFNGSEPGFNSAWTYQWSTGETTAQIFYPYPTAGYYTVWLKVSLNGQSVTDTVHYTVSPPVAVPPLTATTTSACVDSSTVFTPVSAGYTYQWYKADPLNPGNYIPLVGQNGNALTVTVSGEYRIKVTNQGGCFEYNTINVSTLGKPKKYLHDTAFCQTLGQPNFSIGDNLNTNCTYMWNQGNTGDDWVINPNNPQPTPITYWVVITNANNCQTVDSITWVAHPKPTPILLGNQYTCGDSVTLTELSGLYTNVWKLGNTVVANGNSFTTNVLGNYTVTTTNNFGCSVTHTQAVLSSPGVVLSGFNFIPTLPAEPRKIKFVPLNDVNVNQYLWNFGDGSTSTQRTPTHTYTGTDTAYLVTLTVTNTNFTGACRTTNVSQRIAVGLVDTGTTNPPTSIVEVENEAGMMLYPNPATDQLNVTLKEGVITNIVVTDLAGRNIYNTIEKSKEVRLNLSTANPGMYLVRVTVKTNKGEATLTKKINKL